MLSMFDQRFDHKPQVSTPFNRHKLESKNIMEHCFEEKSPSLNDN